MITYPIYIYIMLCNVMYNTHCEYRYFKFFSRVRNTIFFKDNCDKFYY